jgi:hypothetical protein
LHGSRYLHPEYHHGHVNRARPLAWGTSHGVDRATLGWLLLVWEPLFILSIIGLIVFLLGLSAWVFHYGARGVTPCVLFALALASACGCAVVPGQIVASLPVVATFGTP